MTEITEQNNPTTELENDETVQKVDKFEDIKWEVNRTPGGSDIGTARVELPNGIVADITYHEDFMYFKGPIQERSSVGSLYTFKIVEGNDNVAWNERYTATPCDENGSTIGIERALQYPDRIETNGFSQDDMKNIFEDLKKLDKDGNLPPEERDNTHKVMTGYDLEFKPVPVIEFDRDTGTPSVVEKDVAKIEFENGYGVMVRRNNYDDYSVSILDKDGKITCATEISSVNFKKVSSLEEVDAMMKDIQKLDTDGCVQGKELTEKGKELKLIGACERGDVNTVQTLINGGVNVNINVNLVRLGEGYVANNALDLVRNSANINQSLDQLEGKIKTLNLLAQSGLNFAEETANHALAEIAAHEQMHAQNQSNNQELLNEEPIKPQPALEVNSETKPYDYMNDLKEFIKDRTIVYSKFLKQFTNEVGAVVKDAALRVMDKIQQRIHGGTEQDKPKLPQKETRLLPDKVLSDVKQKDVPRE